MIYDFRMYTLKPGATPEYMAAVEEVALPIRKKHGVKLAGWYYSEIGELNQVVHIWAFEDLNQRIQQRQKFLSDPSLAADIAKIREMYVHQESKFLMPAAFSPLK